jgi:hypothetical protein
VVRAARRTLSDLHCDLLYRAFALREQVDDLGTPAASERRGNRRERVEQCALGFSIIHTFKLMLE